VGWYRKAAEQKYGYGSAQISLGFMYENGRGVPQDYATAMSWYRKAADHNWSAAQNNLGLMYAARGLPNGLLFFAVVLSGCGYIVFSKLQGFGAFYVTLVPVLFMIGYALLLGLTRLFRLRDDQSGDNLYYMGFLFTLTSLAVSLYQFSTAGSAAQIVQNFGIAIASTIAGIALRIFFNQMRRDPIEVEHTARLELAQASRKVKREMESSVLEFSYFRRSAQQSIQDALDEMTAMLAEAKTKFGGQLEEFATTSSKPIEEASKRSADTIERLNARISSATEALTAEIAADGSQLSKSTAAIVKAMDGMVTKLTSLLKSDEFSFVFLRRLRFGDGRRPIAL
jgi:hypothetical protein